jgi:acyl carrier protein|tara:strand:- start:77 stop:358 length:282 start_codon:yes stop_codon:yes gene_type:complete
MDYILLFNELTKIIKVAGGKSCEANSLEDSISGIGLDSLDTIMLCLYLGELYGLDGESSKSIPITTLEEMFDFVATHKTTEPESIEAAVEAVR